MSVLTKVLGDPNAREVKRHLERVAEANELEPLLEKLNDDELKAKTAEFRQRLEQGEALDDLLVEAFAVVREAARRTIGLRPFDVQLVGGIVLHQGHIAEMKTGEGKTLVAVLPLYLNALEGKGAHLITVNDYLARRDAGWNAPIYHALGMSVAVMGHEMSLRYDPDFLDETHPDPRLQHLCPVTPPEAYQINRSLKAYTLFKRDRDYLVKDGEVVIVDEFTGRQQPGRRWADGLHQAVEAKEGVKVQQETQTLATITYQNYFRLYKKLAGMTGTAVTEAEEFDKIYKLQVVVIPTHKPMIRTDNADLIYKTEDAKFKAVADEIQETAGSGRPVLVGTVSVEKSERLARLLEKRGVPHEVLNAKQHEREALIVAKAGQPGAVTIATNMAGRGTDIVLGPGVADAGGLHIVGTERHESRRIDNQLRGRSGRQGDPGSSRFFLALDDDLMRIFGGERIRGMMNMLRVADDEPIESRLVSRQIEGAQTKVEGHNFDARRYLVEYDDVMNKQREIIYGERRKVLEGADLREQVQDWIRKAVEDAVNEHCESRHPDNWDLEGLVAQLGAVFPLPPFSELAADEFGETKEAAVERLMEYADAAYKAKETEMTEPMMRKIEQFVVLKTIDSKWISYLTEMEHFKEGIGLRAFGQKDPLVEYKNEAFQAFQELLNGIQFDIASTVFRVQLVKDPPTPTPPAALATARGRQAQAGAATAASRNGGDGNTAPVGADKLGRNDPCWCGSGKKYKKCHGR